MPETVRLNEASELRLAALSEHLDRDIPRIKGLRLGGVPKSSIINYSLGLALRELGIPDPVEEKS